MRTFVAHSAARAHVRQDGAGAAQARFDRDVFAPLAEETTVSTGGNALGFGISHRA